MIRACWIIKRTGICLLSKTYSGMDVDEALFGGFLAAILSFSQEALKIGDLKTILIGSVRIIILPSIEEDLIFSLAFDHDTSEEIASLKLRKIKTEFLNLYRGTLDLQISLLPSFRPFEQVIDQIIEEEDELILTETDEPLNKERLSKALASTMGALRTREIDNKQALNSIINLLEEIDNPDQIQRIASALNSALQVAQGVAPQSEIYNLIEMLNDKIFYWGRSAKIFIFGIDQAGKTAIIQRLRGIENIATRPTIGSSLEQVVFKQIVLTAFDAAGQKEYRAAWISLMRNSDALVFVIDAANPMRFPEAKKELDAILNVEKSNIPFLFISNKKDLSPFQGKTIVERYFELDKITDRPLGFFDTSAKTGEGLTEAFGWLVERLVERWETNKLE